MIPVEINNVILSDKGFVILLKSRQDNRALPIFIGQLEAQSIIIALSDAKPVRPLTHDLMKIMLDELGCTLVRVEVCELENDTFFGKIILEHDGATVELDSRPSDAIALAVRTQTPIFVAPQVMDEAKVFLDESDQPKTTQEVQPEETTVVTEPVAISIEDYKRLLNEAIKKEHYEEAAQLRDKIRKMNTTN